MSNTIQEDRVKQANRVYEEFGLKFRTSTMSAPDIIKGARINAIMMERIMKLEKHVHSTRSLEPSISDLQTEIAEWANKTFPDRTPKNALIKMMVDEIPELIGGGLNDPLELADVAILLLDVAYLQGVDIGSAIREKMEINRGRKWKIDADTGIAQHVQDD